MTGNPHQGGDDAEVAALSPATNGTPRQVGKLSHQQPTLVYPVAVSFNLVDDPWLPVSRRGEVREVSLRTALLESQGIDGLALAPATLMVAVFRQTLLPLVIDALGAPRDSRDWVTRREQGCFDAQVLEAYLEQYRDRFNVFDPVAPFAQVAGLRTAKDEVKPSSLLVPALPTGNNVPLFGSRVEDDPPALPWAQALCWTLHTHCWDTAAIKSGAVGDPKAKNGKTTGNPTGSLGYLGIVVPTGPTLFETLLLNLPIVPADPRPGSNGGQDRPQWGRPPAGPSWSERPAEGILDLLTWQSRRIRLIPSIDDRTGETVVTHVVVAAGDRLLSTPEYEPHTAWTITSSRKGEPALPRPRRHRSGRAAWRGLDALVAGRAPTGNEPSAATSLLLRQIDDLQAEDDFEENFPLGIEIVGVEYGNQSAIVDNVIHDAIPMPVRALRAGLDVGEAVERLARDADEIAKAVNVLEADLCRSLGGDLVPWDKGERASERLIYRLDRPARRVLADLQRHPQKVEEVMPAWAQVARRAALDTADELLSTVPPAAIAGRTSDGRPHRASLAELRFLAQLRTILPKAEPNDPDVLTTTEE